MKVFQVADEITLVHSGPDYFGRLVRLIDEARETIHLQTYIFDADDTGLMVAAALKRAAGRGVRVRVLADGIGSNRLPKSFVQDLQAAGVEFRFFKHIISLWKWSFGRTMHHKVAVADATQALVGGINIADKYKGTAGAPAWLDFAVYIRGNICAQLFELCESVFLRQYWKRRYPKFSFKKKSPPPPRPEGLVRFRQNDWMRSRTEIFTSYRLALSKARHSMVIVASYFLPGYASRQRLAVKARGGIEIKILLTGPSDVYLSRLAEQHLTSWMVRKGIRVFRWTHSVMHGKALLVDEYFTSLGSYNINRLSQIRSMELNVDILDPVFVRHFSHYLNELLECHCEEITAETLEPLNRWQRWKAFLAYHLVYFLMRLLFPQKRH